jgi:hypothetical protein
MPTWAALAIGAALRHAEGGGSPCTARQALPPRLTEIEGTIVRIRYLPGRATGLAAAAALTLAGCASDLPQTSPPADAVPPPSLYTLSPGTPVDGTARITLTRGRGTATGVLDTNGQRFRFTMAGLTTNGAMPARMTVTAQVYGLQRRGDFAGTYRDVGGAASDLDGTLRLGNENLVLMVVRPSGQGIALGVPAGGAVVALSP